MLLLVLRQRAAHVHLVLREPALLVPADIPAVTLVRLDLFALPLSQKNLQFRLSPCYCREWTRFTDFYGGCGIGSGNGGFGVGTPCERGRPGTRSPPAPSRPDPHPAV